MEIARHWRLKDQRYNLIGSVCPKCKQKSFPPREICPKCGSEMSAGFAFNGHGEVYSFTTIYEAPSSPRTAWPWSGWMKVPW
jgi:uncharacterized OB-fold protein